MTNTDTIKKNTFFQRLLASPADRQALRYRKAEERRKRREVDLKVARDLAETGYFNDYSPDAIFHRHSYF